MSYDLKSPTGIYNHEVNKSSKCCGGSFQDSVVVSIMSPSGMEGRQQKADGIEGLRL